MGHLTDIWAMGQRLLDVAVNPVNMSKSAAFWDHVHKYEETIGLLMPSSPAVKEFKDKLAKDVILTVQSMPDERVFGMSFNEVFSILDNTALSVHKNYPKDANANDILGATRDLMHAHAVIDQGTKDFIERDIRRTGQSCPFDLLPNLVPNRLNEIGLASEFLVEHGLVPSYSRPPRVPK